MMGFAFSNLLILCGRVSRAVPQVPNTSILIFGDVLLLPPTLLKADREILALGPNYTQYLGF